MATFSTHVDEWSCGLTGVSALVDNNSHFAAFAASSSMHPCAAAFDKYSDCSSSGSESTDIIHGTNKGAFARKVGISSISAAATDVPSSSGEDTSSWSLPLTQDSSLSDCCSDSDEDVDLGATDGIVYPIRVLLQLRASVSTRAALAPSVVYGTRRIDALQCDHHSASSTAEITKEIPASVSSSKKKRNSLPCSSSTSWSAKQRASSTISLNDDVSIEKASRSILNKLTIEKFDSLYEQLATCGVSTPEHIKILMREVFEKATVQHHFIAMYADLCVRLEADPRLAPAMGAVGEPTSFRHLLLHQCQVAFEQLLEPRAEDVNESDLTPEAKDEQELLRKRRALGNVKFVGQLMVRGMLSSRLLVACSDALLRGQTTCPEALESLAALLTVAGKKFDRRSDWQYSDRLDAIFIRLRELTKDKTVSARVRFLLRDLLELRDAGWPEQGLSAAIAKEGPMRLEEVKERAAEEVCQKTAGASAPSRQHRGSKNKESKAVVTARLDTLQRIVSNGSKTPAEKIPGPSQQSKQSNGNANSQRSKDQQQQQAKGNSNGKKQVSGGANHGKARPSVAAPCLLSMAQAAPAPQQEQKKPTKVAVTEPEAPPMAVTAKSEAAANDVATVAVAPPIITAVTPAPPVVVPFSLKMFKRELSATLKELSSERNVAAAVRRIRAQNVPTSHHATEFTDLLTRAAEETRGPARRSAFAFAAGLAAADPSCFDRAECISGAREFFAEVYQELCSEVPRLPAIAASELVPTLRSVFPASALNEILPQELRAL